MTTLTLAMDPTVFHGTIFADFAFLRLAGLPARYGRIASETCGKTLRRQLRQLQQRQRQTGERSVERLHAAIHHHQDRDIRRSLLLARRALFNQRAFPLPTPARQWLQQHHPDIIALLTEHQQLEAECQRLNETFRLAVAESLARTERMLQQACHEPAFLQGLTLAAPSLYRTLSRYNFLLASMPRKKRQASERSLLNYLLRATMKISPFSSFGTVLRVQADRQLTQGSFTGEAFSLRSCSMLNRSVALSLREALYQPETLIERNLPLQRNASLRLVRGMTNGALAIRGRARFYPLRQGTLWAEEHSVQSRQLLPVWSFLESLPPHFSPAELIERLATAGYAVEEAAKTVRLLLRKDWLRPAIQWGASQPRPATCLAAFLERQAAEGSTMPDLAAIAAEIRELEEQARRFASAEIAQRPALAEALTQRWHQLHARLSRRPPAALRTPVYENVTPEGLDLKLPRAFIDGTLQRVARTIARYTTFSIEYLWLHYRFIQTWGEGGRCDNAADFLERLWPEFIAFSAGHSAALHQEILQLRRTIQPSALRLPLTVYAQLATDDIDTLLHGEPLVVINAAFHRIGWQSSRMTGEGADSAQQQAVAGWLEAAASPLRSVTLPVSGEASSLQAHDRLSAQRIVIDEQPQKADDWQLQDLRLRHNPTSGLIELLGPDDRPFQLNYLGGATPMAAWEAKYLLIALAEPLQVGRPAPELIMATEEDKKKLAENVRCQPRLVEEGCVLIRATWWIRSSWLLALCADESPHARLAALLDLADEWQIPEELFVSGQHSDFLSWEAIANVGLRKPMWCHLNNPHCVNYLLALAREAEWLVLREALPAPTESWCRIGGEQYVSEFMFEMVTAVDGVAINLMGE